MSQNINRLYGGKLVALDGDIGHLKDFYFDDASWVVRYLAVETESWLSGREVLLSPQACRFLRHDGRVIFITLTREQIDKSPSSSLHHTVSRQFEIDYYRHYGWPPYWQGAGKWGSSAFPEVTPLSVVLSPSIPESDVPEHMGDIHLRSTSDVTGYHLQATDGTIGAVSGFMLDDKSWTMPELVVEAGHWYSGKKIRIATSRVDRISSQESKVFVNLTKAEIQRTGEYQLAISD